MEAQNKMKLISWIQFCYKTYDLDTASQEIYLFLKRSEFIGLITPLVVEEMLAYSKGKYDLGKELDEYEEVYFKEDK